MSMKTKQCKCASCAGAACKCGVPGREDHSARLKIAAAWGIQCKCSSHLQLQGRLSAEIGAVSHFAVSHRPSTRTRWGCAA